MNTEAKKTKPKWYQMPRWRWLPPGGYYGGFFAGFGLGIMMLASAVICDYISVFWSAVAAVGAGILVISNLVCYSLETLYDKKQHRRDG